MVSSGTKVASSLRVGLSNSLRMKRQCQASWASAPVGAGSYSSGYNKFQLTASRSVKPNLSAPYSGLRMPCSNIHFLPRRRSVRACDLDDDRLAVMGRPTGTPQRPTLADGRGEFRHVTLVRRAARLRQAGDEHVPV